MVADRTCVVCREPTGVSEHPGLRLQLIEGQVVVSPPRLKGRGVWVCVKRACLEKLGARHLSRGFRKPLASFAPEAWRGQVRALAERRVLETVGLARRSGQLEVGLDSTLREGVDGVGWVANDLSPRSQRRAAHLPTFVEAARMGRAAGLGAVGAMKVRAGPLAERAALWLALWCETRPHDTACKSFEVPNG